MKTRKAKSQGKKLGTERRRTSSSSLAKSKPRKHLAKEVGNASSAIPGYSETQPVPKSRSIAPQVSAPPADTRASGHSTPSPFASQLPLARAAQAQWRETSIEDSPMPARLNPFRAQLASMPVPGTEKGARRASFLRALPIAAKALYLDESPIDFKLLIAAAAPWSGSETTDMNLYAALQPLVAEKRILTSKSASSGSGTSPYALDLASERPFAVLPSLRDLLVSYEHGPWSATAIASTYAGIRTLLALPSHARREDVLKAAEHVTARQFHSLSSQLRRRAYSEGAASTKTIANYVSSIRALLCFGLERDLFPLYFPTAADTDPSAWLVDATFPRRSSRILTQDERAARSGLAAILRVARAEGLLSDQGVSSPVVAREAVLRLGSPLYRRERNLVGQLRTALMRDCPQQLHPASRPFLDAIAESGRTGALPYLGARRHNGAGTNIEKLIELMESEGLPPAWREFLTWYHDFCTLDWRVLLARKEDFPTRPAGAQLSAHSFYKRLASIRAMLGILKEREPSAFPTATPEAVFGPRLRDLLSDAMTRWSIAAGRPSGPSHPASGGIVDIVDSAGLIARALFERSLHARGLASMGRVNQVWSPGAADMISALGPIELCLWEAARFARAVATNLTNERKDSTSATGNTVKDLGQAITQTPVSHFVIAQTRLLREVKMVAKRGLDLAESDREVVVGTLINGVLLSSAMRLEEVCHLRLGFQVQMAPWEDRSGRLRPVDRKNGVPNTFTLSERYLPEWFLRFYLAIADHIRAELSTGPSANDHPWLVLDPSSGLPFGCPEETPEGKNRNDVALVSRKNACREVWQDVVSAAFRRCDLKVPHESRQFGPHIVRGVLGHAVYQKFGLKAAANLLGDTESVVERHYRLLAGASVDTSDIDEGYLIGGTRAQG